MGVVIKRGGNVRRAAAVFVRALPLSHRLYFYAAASSEGVSPEALVGEWIADGIQKQERRQALRETMEKRARLAQAEREAHDNHEKQPAALAAAPPVRDAARLYSSRRFS